MRILGINFSSRKDGNCSGSIDYCLNCFAEDGHEIEKIDTGDYDIDSCGHCGYICFSNGQCVKKDSVTMIYERCIHSEVIIVALPTFNGHLVSTYFAFSERAQGLFKSKEVDYDIDFLKKVNIIVIGNPSAGGDMALHEALFSFNNKEYYPEAILMSTREYSQKAIDGNLKNDDMALIKYDGFVKRIKEAL